MSRTPWTTAGALAVSRFVELSERLMTNVDVVHMWQGLEQGLRVKGAGLSMHSYALYTYITLQYSTVQYSTLPYLTLPYLTLHYITYIRRYTRYTDTYKIHVHILMHIHIYIYT